VGWFHWQLVCQAAASAADYALSFTAHQLNPHRFFAAPWAEKNSRQSFLWNAYNLSAPSPQILTLLSAFQCSLLSNPQFIMTFSLKYLRTNILPFIFQKIFLHGTLLRLIGSLLCLGEKVWKRFLEMLRRWRRSMIG